VIPKKFNGPILDITTVLNSFLYKNIQITGLVTISSFLVLVPTDYWFFKVFEITEPSGFFDSDFCFCPQRTLAIL
jgi:hypothetical protein